MITAPTETQGKGGTTYVTLFATASAVVFWAALGDGSVRIRVEGDLDALVATCGPLPAPFTAKGTYASATAAGSVARVVTHRLLDWLLRASDGWPAVPKGDSNV
mgnify:CR=1 FL=1